MKVKWIIIVILIISLYRGMAEANNKSKIIIRSFPEKCQVVFLNQDIHKETGQIVIENVQAGVYPIIFKSEGETLKADINVKSGDILLINGSFKRMEITATSGIFMGKDNFPMVLIPAGEFQMGSNEGEEDEVPVHSVYLDSFYIDVFEITNAQYKKFMEETGYKAPRYWNDPKYNSPSQPVVGVSWDDAQAYCKWANKRLPTEAEWEKAARGGLVGKTYPWGDEAGIVTMEENSQNPTAGTYGVGSLKPNNYGIYDLEGNVWEWCADWYDEKYYEKSAARNPKGPESGDKRVLRGGSWSAGIYAPLRVSYRYSFDPKQSSNLIGFRCAMSLE